MTKEEFTRFKRETASIARDLCYGAEVVERIRKAQSQAEVERILIDARRNL